MHRYSNMGTALMRAGRYDEGTLPRSLPLSRSPAWYVYSYVMRDCAAIALFKRSLVLDPQMAVAWQNLCELLTALGRPVEAAEACRP